MKDNIKKITIDLKDETVEIEIFKVVKGEITHLDENYFKNKQERYIEFVRENEILNMEALNRYFIKYGSMMVCVDITFISEMKIEDKRNIVTNSQLKMSVDPSIPVNKWFTDEMRKDDIKIMFEVICAVGQLTVPDGGKGEVIAPSVDEIFDTVIDDETVH